MIRICLLSDLFLSFSLAMIIVLRLGYAIGLFDPPKTRGGSTNLQDIGGAIVSIPPFRFLFGWIRVRGPTLGANQLPSGLPLAYLVDPPDFFETQPPSLVSSWHQKHKDKVGVVCLISGL